MIGRDSVVPLLLPSQGLELSLPPYRALISKSIRSSQRWVISTFCERSGLLRFIPLHLQPSLGPVLPVDEHITRNQRNHLRRIPDYPHLVNSLICHPFYPRERMEGAAVCTRKWLVAVSDDCDQRDGSSKARYLGHYRVWTRWAYCCYLPCACKPRACLVRRLHG